MRSAAKKKKKGKCRVSEGAGPTPGRVVGALCDITEGPASRGLLWWLESRRKQKKRRATLRQLGGKVRAGIPTMPLGGQYLCLVRAAAGPRLSFPVKSHSRRFGKNQRHLRNVFATSLQSNGKLKAVTANRPRRWGFFFFFLRGSSFFPPNSDITQLMTASPPAFEPRLTFA